MFTDVHASPPRRPTSRPDSALSTRTRAGLVTRALFELARTDLAAAFGGFRRLHRLVGNTPRTSVQSDDARNVVRAVHRACIYYPKPVKCLQRAVVVTRMLRQRGIDATLVIGCQKAPVRSHAWVDVEGQIVSGDKRDRLHHYQIMDRW